MPAGLHHSIPTREKLQHEHAYLVRLWRELDELHPTVFTAGERANLERAKHRLEEVIAELGAAINLNAGKPTTRWT